MGETNTPAFKNATIRLENQSFNRAPILGSIIYKSPWGYCYVRNVSIHGELTLVHPGFGWDEKQLSFIKYNFDNVYVPLKFEKFISVDIII